MLRLTAYWTDADGKRIEKHPQAGCPVVLDGPGRTILICGKTVRGLSGGAYKVIEGLVSAYPHGLTRHQLNELSGLKDARAVLRHLTQRGHPRRRDTWADVLHYDGEPCRGQPGRHVIRWPAPDSDMPT